MTALGRFFLLQKVMLISLLSQEIDKRMVGQLVADEHGMKSGFPEGCQDTFLMKEAWKILCRAADRSIGTLLWVVLLCVVASEKTVIPGVLESSGLVFRG